MNVPDRKARIEGIMMAVIGSIREYQSLLREGRNAKITLHITGLELAQVDFNLFSKLQGEKDRE